MFTKDVSGVELEKSITRMGINVSHSHLEDGVLKIRDTKNEQHKEPSKVRLIGAKEFLAQKITKKKPNMKRPSPELI